MPALREMLRGGGEYGIGRGQMPSLTNPNNMSIVTGAPPGVHGIHGNHYLKPAGAEEQLVDPVSLASTDHLRLPWTCPRDGVGRVGELQVASPARRGRVSSVSAERAAGFGLPQFGIASLPPLVGRPAPGVYDWDLSAYALEICSRSTAACGLTCCMCR